MPGQGITRIWTSPASPVKGRSSLKVLQWNVLADGLAQHGDFVKAPQQALGWSFRANMFIQQILEPHPDIVCLQEVNRYDDFFLPALEKHGYVGNFFRKPCSPAEQYGAPCDGCALFYLSKRFDSCAQPQGQTFRTIDGVAGNQGMLMMQLCDRESGARICAATTHLKAKSGATNDAIRDHQVQDLLSELEQACRSYTHKSEPMSQLAAEQSSLQQPLVILCGDFNTTPESSTCQLIAGHPLRLKSSWDTYPGMTDQSGGRQTQQPFSTWKFRSDGESKRIIDFIWYSMDERLQLVSHWQLPSDDMISSAGLPSLEYPSDHLALCCKFSIAQEQRRVLN